MKQYTLNPNLLLALKKIRVVPPHHKLWKALRVSGYKEEVCNWTCTPRANPTSLYKSIELSYQGQKRQWIAVWTLLYHLQLPCTYERRVRSVLVQNTPLWLVYSSMINPEEGSRLLYVMDIAAHHNKSPKPRTPAVKPRESIG